MKEKKVCGRKKRQIERDIGLLDFFGADFKLKLPLGRSQLTTYAGVFISVLIRLLVGFYGITKLTVLIGRKDHYVMEASQVNVYDESMIFNETQGVSFAAAFTSYQKSEFVEEDKTLATLNITYEMWG